MNTHLVYPLCQVYGVIFLCSHQGTAWQEYNCRMAYPTKTTWAMNQSFKSVFLFDLMNPFGEWILSTFAIEF